MAYEVGYVDNLGSEGLAHWQMLLKIKTFAEAHGWVTLRYTAPTDGSNRELIMVGPGLSGDKQIYVGFRTYHNVANDYYNLSVAGFTGYVSSNAFSSQPGYVESGIPGHNQRIDYWLTVNGQRIAFGLKVGTPVYEHGYVGFFFPYASPAQYPYPMAVIGMLASTPATRFSDTTHSMGYKGAVANGAMRFVDGTYKNPSLLPWGYTTPAAGSFKWRDTNGRYKPVRAAFYDVNGVYGELDGIYHITGFNNVVENTFTTGGKSYVVLQDVSRTGFNDYYALELG